MVIFLFNFVPKQRKNYSLKKVREFFWDLVDNQFGNFFVVKSHGRCVMELLGSGGRGHYNLTELHIHFSKWYFFLSAKFYKKNRNLEKQVLNVRYNVIGDIKKKCREDRQLTDSVGKLLDYVWKLPDYIWKLPDYVWKLPGFVGNYLIMLKNDLIMLKNDQIMYENYLIMFENYLVLLENYLLMLENCVTMLDNYLITLENYLIHDRQVDACIETDEED